MMKSLAALLLIAGLMPAPAATRLKDLVSVEGVRDNPLVGYGLVIGLAGTGDKRTTIFSTQSLANTLERMGVSVSPTAMRVQNVASVIVTATLPPFAQPRHQNRYHRRGGRRRKQSPGRHAGHDANERRQRAGVCRCPRRGGQRVASSRAVAAIARR